MEILKENSITRLDWIYSDHHYIIENIHLYLTFIGSKPIKTERLNPKVYSYLRTFVAMLDLQYNFRILN